MELNLNNRLIIVTGASSGFGEAVARQLIAEGATVLAIARRTALLDKMAAELGDKCEILTADVSNTQFPEILLEKLQGRIPDGIFVNGGGPPAAGFSETTRDMWINAFHNIFLWKVDLVKKLLPLFKMRNYGRIVFLESISVKQPVENLILSNSIRSAMAGMAKTLAGEIASFGITVNVLAPGYHDTAAMQRLYSGKAEKTGQSVEEVKRIFINETGTGKLGNPAELANLAVWLLSPNSSFVTGQVITIAGNQVKGILG
ncbi:MAG: SDR family oxidoreductase [Lentimicrobium sp.]|nr:SDR family oxidoreductase [Lentimicrobium sp.]